MHLISTPVTLNYYDATIQRKMLNFVSFGNKARFPKSLSRIETEARELGVFKDVFVWNEDDLDAVFYLKHRWYMQPGTRGFGYWIWKPHVILKALRRIPEGEFLLYTDAGCAFNASGKQRLIDYMEMARASPKGVFGFNLIIHKERTWNKMDTMLKVFPDGVPHDVFESPQCLSGIHMWHNTPEARAFVEEWQSISISDGFRYIDDSPSEHPNASDFRDHRHDQAIFSLLLKKYGVPTIPDETWHAEDWASFNWPIHAARLRV